VEQTVSTVLPNRAPSAFDLSGRAADIGCDSGRDTAWLTRNGYPAIGYDAWQGLLAEARRRYPGLPFREGALYRTWRVTVGSDRRDELGRLYAAFDTELVTDALSSGKILFDEAKASASSNKTIHRIAARKA
jgi:hypothetical protein